MNTYTDSPQLNVAAAVENLSAFPLPSSMEKADSNIEGESVAPADNMPPTCSLTTADQGISMNILARMRPKQA